MVLERRSYLRPLVVYLAALAVLLGGSFLSFAGVFYAFEGSREHREPTRLEINTQAAREIRQALATPIPPPPPLQPITVSRAHPIPPNHAVVTRHEQRKASTKGFDALAMSSTAEFSSSASKGSDRPYPTYDRHAPQ